MAWLRALLRFLVGGRPAPAPPPPPPPMTAEAIARRLLELTNAARAARHQSPLLLGPRTTAAAVARARRLAVYGALTHADLGDGTLETRLGLGLAYSAVAENIAIGDTPEQVVAEWMDDDLHRRNLLGNYTEMGVGTAPGVRGIFWVADYGRSL